MTVVAIVYLVLFCLLVFGMGIDARAEQAGTLDFEDAITPGMAVIVGLAGAVLAILVLAR